MRLGIVQILQAVFDVAQKHITVFQIFGDVLWQQVVGRQLVQQGARGTHAQGMVLTATDELKNLGDEFNFSNATGAELDVVCLVLLCHFAADLHVQVAHRGKRAKIKILAKHEGQAQLF